MDLLLRNAWKGLLLISAGIFFILGIVTIAGVILILVNGGIV